MSLIVALLIAALPATALAAFVLLSRRFAKQPVGTVVPEFEPLPQATVLFDAVLASADQRALPAALLDLAVRRKIRILAPPDFGRKHRKKAQRQPLVIELAEGAEFTDQERQVLTVFLGGAFAQGTQRRLSTMSAGAGKRGSTLMAKIVSQLAANGLIAQRVVRWPRIVTLVFAWIGVAATLFIAIGFAASVSEDSSAVAALIVTVLALFVAIAVIIWGKRPWRKFLPPSQAARRHLAGMRVYIQLAEQDRMRALQAPRSAERAPVTAQLDQLLLHERLLPYAVLFGLEKEWAEVLRKEAQSFDPTVAEHAADALLVVGLAIELADAVHSISEAASAIGRIVDAGGAIVKDVDEVLDAFRR